MKNIIIILIALFFFIGCDSTTQTKYGSHRKAENEEIFYLNDNLGIAISYGWCSSSMPSPNNVVYEEEYAYSLIKAHWEGSNYVYYTGDKLDKIYISTLKYINYIVDKQLIFGNGLDENNKEIFFVLNKDNFYSFDTEKEFSIFIKKMFPIKEIKLILTRNFIEDMKE